MLWRGSEGRQFDPSVTSPEGHLVYASRVSVSRCNREETQVTFSADVLQVDAKSGVEQISATRREQVMGVLKKKGVVVGLSGGIDSSVCAALAAKAFGKDKVLGLFMPERDSSSDALTLGRMLADCLGITAIVEDIAPALTGAGCYARQIEAIRAAVPEYGDGWKCKITLPSILEAERLNVFQLTVQSPAGEVSTTRLPLAAYLQLVAATN